MSSKTEPWERRRGTVRSRKGGWLIGQGVYCHGHDLMEDLVGHVSYMQLLVLNATGRLVERRLADWLEARQMCLSWPDPRIWCNQVGALGASLGNSVVAGTVAGILAADSRGYGGSRTAAAGMHFIQEALAAHRAGLAVDAIVERECARHGGKPYLMGYRRPIAKGDERIAAMERVGRDLGFEPGAHLRLAYAIEALMQARFDEGMNINGYTSAFLSDQGFTPEEGYRISATLVASGVTACHVDQSDRPRETFLPLHCDDIDYRGAPDRDVPPRDDHT